MSSKGSYYNEFDPYAAQWLRNMIEARLIPPGEVDDRSITDVDPDDLRGFSQCHFFAGITGWAFALQAAGWPVDREVWTGSPPCQPFSPSGKQQGYLDPRDLWPKFFDLIRACRPTVVMGEQVAGAIGFGWLDRVFSDMEGEGYACEAAVLPACAVDAPQRRDRLWLVADTDGPRGAPGVSAPRPNEEGDATLSHDGSDGRAGPWGECRRIVCTTGKTWRVEPDFPLLANGVSNRSGRLRAYGNAIVPQVAERVIRAYLAARP